MSGDQPYLRPVPCPGDRPACLPLAGGPLGFSEVEVLQRDAAPYLLPVAAAAALFPGAGELVERISALRAPRPGIVAGRAAVMGVLNVTPDSFSDGGRLAHPDAAVAQGLALIEAGADIVDIGGESTRPGADPVPAPAELDRVMPVLEGLVAAGCPVPISVDTRRAAVARAALDAGAVLFNDVSALTHDPDSPGVAATAPGVCLMHARGDPRTMQDDPRYDDVLLDVYDFLVARLEAAAAAGVDRARILVDPGIGFGKTMTHNLALMARLSLFHGLGCPVLLGASRKRFIGTLSGVADPARRVAGSIAAALAGVAAGVQVLRVHDVAETVQAVRVWQAVRTGTAPGTGNGSA